MNTCVKLTLTLSLVFPLVSGCSHAQTATPQSYPVAQEQPAAEFSQGQLDSLLAPIALYPDTVLSHVLIASTYPLEVVQADRWARSHKQLQGDDAVNAVENQDWDPSVKALVAFPDILRRMSDDLDWTQQLGDAFLANESQVMDTVQNLRSKAYASGNLDKMEHVKVVREDRIISIEPAVERVVYVPVYDTRVVYGSWWWPDYPPIYWNHPTSYVYVSGFYWGPRVYIGSPFFFTGCHWHERRVVVINHYHDYPSHHYYNNRAIIHNHDSRYWNHNPTHRRGVAYYDNHTRERYNSPRESYRDSHTYRANLPSANTNIRPNQARDRRQEIKDRPNFGHQESRPQQSGQTMSRDPRSIRADRMESAQTQAPSVDRAQQLRDRLGNTQNENRGGRSLQSNERQPNSDNRQIRGQVERSDTQPTPYRGNDSRTPRIISREAAPTQSTSGLNPRTERNSEQPSRQIIRPSQDQNERTERFQRDETRNVRSDETRSFRTNERQESGRSGREERQSIRGGRDR